MNFNQYFPQNKKICFFLIIFLFTYSGLIFANPVYLLDFTDATGDVQEWFKQRGWAFKEDINKMNLRFENQSLVFEPKDDYLGIIYINFKDKNKTQKFIHKARKLSIEWGVNQYPLGADWGGVNQEAVKKESRLTRTPIGLMVFFGEETIDSGSIFIPNLPYFIGFFLGEKEKSGVGYYGHYWQKGGRFLCESCEGLVNNTITTQVNLSNKFKELYKIEMRPITGLAIEVDVRDTQKSHGRYSKAYIKKIKFFE